MSRLFGSEVSRYVLGFILSLALSISAYELAVSGGISVFSTLTIVLLLLATIQMVAQVLLFLHVSSEQKPRWQTYSYIFTWIMLLIIVIGSIWIMRNLDYNMHISPDHVEEYMFEQAKKGF